MLKQIGVRDFCQLRAIEKNQGIQDAKQGLNMAETYLLAMIILFLNKFKTASKYFHIFHLPFDRLSAIFLTFVF